MLTLPTLNYERVVWGQGYRYVVGLDEVGRGSWAGPVVAAAVIFPLEIAIPLGLRDSKQLSDKRREELDKEIRSLAHDLAVGVVEADKIDEVGISQATQLAFKHALKNLKAKPDFYLIDAFYLKNLKKKFQQPIVKGDEKCATISAASVIAKVFRDHLMRQFHHYYPQYGFDVHKGYGTKRHQEAIRRYGFCGIHRKSFNLNYLP
jgi:ribonuclease HII